MVAAGPVTVSGGPMVAGGAAGPAALDPPRACWALVVEQGPHAREGWAFVIPPGARMVAGRASDVDMHLQDTFVSSHHARVEAEAGGLMVADLASTNGTSVNGEEMAGAALLGPADRLTVGDTVFVVEER